MSFYRAIATALGSDVPAVDFEQYERQLVELEETCAKQPKSVDLMLKMAGAGTASDIFSASEK
jgi:hypothetical protein